MRCVIAGSRTIGVDANGKQLTLEEFPLMEQAFTKFDWYDSITEIVSGTARGMDIMGEYLAEKRGLKVSKFPANWTKFGRGAGHIRNKEMALYADIAIILWDGKSRGAKNMAENMKKLKKPYMLFKVIGDELCLVR